RVHCTDKIIPYQYIPGYNLLISPEEQMLKGLVDFYFRPEYSKIEGMTAQIEDMWE
ncbi:9882_t:CDS:1, partial [Gigaspora rosea]